MSLCTVSDDFEKYFKLSPISHNKFRGISTSYATKYLNPNIPRRVTITQLEPLSGSTSRRLFMLRDLDHVRFPKVYGCMVYRHVTYVITDSWESTADSLTEVLAWSGRRSLSIMERRMIVKQLIDGIEYLHSLDYVHRNLIPDNILVTGRGKDIAIQIVGLDHMCQTCTETSPTPGSLPNLERVLLKRPAMSWQKMVLKLSDLWAFGQIVIALLVGQSDLHIFEMYGLFELDDIINGEQEWHHRVTAENIKARIYRDPMYRLEHGWSDVQRYDGLDQEWQVVDDNVVVDMHDPFIDQQPDDDWQLIQTAGASASASASASARANRESSNHRAVGPSWSRNTAR